MLLDPRPSPSLTSLSTHPSPTPSPPPPPPPPPPPQPPHPNLLDDIFSSSRSPSPQASRPTSPSDPSAHYQNSSSNHPSDIPRLRSTHSTAGYREGLAAAKTAALQAGFDEGFALGVVIGGKVGELAGVLEGVCRALGAGGRVKGGGKGRVRRRDGGKENEEGEGEGSRNGEEGREHEAIQRVSALRQAAAAELSFQNIFASELWDADGVWKWDVPPLSGTAAEGPRASTTTAEGDDDITFPVVAAAHPAIKKWTAIVGEVMREWGVERGVFEGEEWEAGRVGN